MKPPGMPLHYMFLSACSKRLNVNGSSDSSHTRRGNQLLIDYTWFAAPDTSPLVSRGLSLITRGPEQRHRLHFAGSFREQQRCHPIYARSVVGIRCE